MKRSPPASFPPLNSAPAALVKRAARIVHFEPGSRWRLGSALVTVLGPLSSDRVLVRHAGDNRSEAVAASALETANQFEALGGEALEQYSQAVWAKALKEQGAVTGLLEVPGLSKPGEVARSLGISERQLRRKIQRFVALGTLEAFLPHRRGRQPGSTHLHPDLERLMRDEILQALKDSGDVGVDDLHPMLAASAIALGLRPPSRATVTRRLRQARRQDANLPASIAREIAYRNKPVRGSLSAEAPLNRVEMDHTVCDVHIVEPVSACPIGRPVLTLMIDEATRVILGMLLSLEAPSRLSVGLCLHHGVFPKQKWLQGLGLPEGCWPGFGLLRTLFTDNGHEFHTLSLRRAAQVYGIGLEYRPPGDPAAGGIIERAIGTFMGKVRLLPGASYSQALGKKPGTPIGRPVLR